MCTLKNFLSISSKIIYETKTEEEFVEFYWAIPLGVVSKKIVDDPKQTAARLLQSLQLIPEPYNKKKILTTILNQTDNKHSGSSSTVFITTPALHFDAFDIQNLASTVLFQQQQILHLTELLKIDTTHSRNPKPSTKDKPNNKVTIKQSQFSCCPSRRSLSSESKRVQSPCLGFTKALAQPRKSLMKRSAIAIDENQIVFTPTPPLTFCYRRPALQQREHSVGAVSTAGSTTSKLTSVSNHSTSDIGRNRGSLDRSMLRNDSLSKHTEPSNDTTVCLPRSLRVASFQLNCKTTSSTNNTLLLKGGVTENQLGSSNRNQLGGSLVCSLGGSLCGSAERLRQSTDASSKVISSVLAMSRNAPNEYLSLKRPSYSSNCSETQQQDQDSNNSNTANSSNNNVSQLFPKCTARAPYIHVISTHSKSPTAHAKFSRPLFDIETTKSAREAPLARTALSSAPTVTKTSTTLVAKTPALSPPTSRKMTTSENISAIQMLSAQEGPQPPLTKMKLPMNSSPTTYSKPSKQRIN